MWSGYRWHSRPPRGHIQSKSVRTEEKGSDVNLATHILVDCFNSDYDAAVIVSNDTDLLEPIRVVRGQLGYPVGVLNPQKQQIRVLAKAATLYKRIRQGPLQASRFPPTLTDAHGTITKPQGW